MSHFPWGVGEAGVGGRTGKLIKEKEEEEQDPSCDPLSTPGKFSRDPNASGV